MAATQTRFDTPPTVRGDSADDIAVLSDNLFIPPAPPKPARIEAYSFDDDPFVVDWAPPGRR